MDQRACFAPMSVKEAISLLSEYGEKAEVIAGGTDLLVQMKRGDAVPDYLINMEGLKELEYIRHDVKEGLRIGARTPIHAIVKSALIGDRFEIIANAGHLAELQHLGRTHEGEVERIEEQDHGFLARIIT